MRERPILFSGPMVRAILEGRKTQTRRSVKPQPDISVLKKSARDLEFEFRRMPVLGPTHTPAEWGFCPKYDKPECVPIYGYKCPYGQPGDRLWVRETFAKNEVMPIEDRPKGDFIYRADLNGYGVSKWAARWTPSIFMPRNASRIMLEITSIRVERLQDISGPDCWAEGITHDCDKYGSVTHTYQYLWESIKGSGSWDANPFVWVVTFRRIDHA